MLIAFFTILLLGGSSTATLAYIADTQDTVKTVMEKDGRQIRSAQYAQSDEETNECAQQAREASVEGSQ